MNLQQLETFLTVIELGSFTKAAERLNSTQSTVSMRISELEQELGVQLLDRSQRRIRPTSKGRDLLKYASEINRLKQAIHENVGDSEKLTGTIRLGVTELIAVTWLPALITALNQHYPKIDLELEVGVSGNIYDKIGAGDFDILVLPRDRTMAPGLVIEDLYESEFRFFANPSLGLDGRKIQPQELQAQTVIAPDRNSSIARIQARWFQDNDINPTCIRTSNSMEICAILARSGFGVALLAYDYYKREVPTGQLVPLNVSPSVPMVPFSAVYLDGVLPPHVSKTIELIRQIVQSGAL
ncbi:LysR family transcriptional regulator [Hwanghaeella sp.]|uniref:LysR family transcriptional regulator n=1 Tax=Hwanghaeella sp. TaxID=2605943 RepID=UPI003CCC33C1